MSELSPKAQALVKSGRAALRPSADDRARVLTGLQPRIAGPVPSPVPRAFWLAASAAVMAAGVAAAIGLSAPEPVAPPPAPSASLASAAVVGSGAGALPAAPAMPAATLTPVPEAVSPPASAPSARRSSDRLAEEVAILSQAAKALRAGRAAEALRALNDHQRRFPTGLLTLERRAARAEALCSLGRASEAEAELSTLTRAAPSSPLIVRAQQRCGARPAAPR